MDASDPCSSAREPIVKAGDDLDARQRQMANQMAQQQMQGHELPVVTTTAAGRSSTLETP